METILDRGFVILVVTRVIRSPNLGLTLVLEFGQYDNVKPIIKSTLILG